MRRRDFLTKSLIGSLGYSLFPLHSEGGAVEKGLKYRHAGESRQERGLYFDGLSFISEKREDIKESGLSGFIWDVSAVETINGKYVRPLVPCLKSISKAAKLLAQNDLGVFLATRGSQIRDAGEKGLTAAFLQFQSCEPMTQDLELMDVFYQLGLRILQLTHHSTNPFGGGSIEKEWTGLTDLGFKAVEKMNQLSIVTDLSHGNEKLCADVLKTSLKPVIISHTGCRAIVNNARCAPDSVIKGVADSGGVVGIFSISCWLTEDPVPTVESYVRQLEHVIRVGGIDAVGISNDFTIAGNLEAKQLGTNSEAAMKMMYPWWKEQVGVLGFDKLPQHYVIPELNNARRLFTIQAALEKKGYTSREIEKIMGGNWIRVLTESLG